MKTILAMETSCEETSAAVLTKNKVLSSVISSQEIHSKFGGVVPELASREHVRLITPIVNKAISEAWVQNEIDNNMLLAKKIGLMGTPAFVVLNSNNFSQSLIVSADHPQVLNKI